MPKPGIIIQARMGSTRLPGKVLMPLCGLPMLHHLWLRMKASRVQNVIIATTLNEEDDAIEDWAKKNGILLFRGSADNVLERYIRAAEIFEVDPLIRVTGDNPLTAPEIIDDMLGAFIAEKVDYMTASGLPVGISAEIVNYNCLKSLLTRNLLPRHYEHVTLFIKENPGYFKIKLLPSPPALAYPHLRLTVDTSEDFHLMEEIFEKFYRPGRTIQLTDVINWLKQTRR